LDDFASLLSADGDANGADAAGSAVAGLGQRPATSCGLTTVIQFPEAARADLAAQRARSFSTCLRRNLETISSQIASGKLPVPAASRGNSSSGSRHAPGLSLPSPCSCGDHGLQ
jgi:hypothetical protein